MTLEQRITATYRRLRHARFDGNYDRIVALEYYLDHLLDQWSTQHTRDHTKQTV